MILKIIGYDNSKNILFDLEFPGNGWFETPFCYWSDKLGLTSVPKEYSLNTKESIMLRKNRKLTDEQKKALLDSNNLNDKIKDILKIALNDKMIISNNVNINSFKELLSGQQFGIIEDINSNFEELKKEFKIIEELVLEKIKEE